MKKVYVVKTVSGSEYLMREEDGKFFVHGRHVLKHAHIAPEHHMPDDWQEWKHIKPWPPRVGEVVNMTREPANPVNDFRWRRTSLVESVSEGVHD